MGIQLSAFVNKFSLSLYWLIQWEVVGRCCFWSKRNCTATSDVNKDLGLKAKAKDFDVKAKDLGPKAKAKTKDFDSKAKDLGPKDLGPKAKAKDLRCQGQMFQLSFYIVF